MQNSNGVLSIANKRTVETKSTKENYQFIHPTVISVKAKNNLSITTANV
jgi:hypothetical protein